MYGKIFRSIYYGSLAPHRASRELMTFLVVHSDKEGWVDMTLRAAGRVLGLSNEETAEAAERLWSPDPHSTSPAEEGRRILARDLDTRGIKIVNYELYRAIRSEEDKRDYQRNYYQNVTKPKRLSNRVKQSQSRVNGHSSDSIQAEAEAEGDAEKKKPMVSKLTVSVPKHAPEAFQRFWSKYPKKKGRLEAVREWDRLKPSEVDLLAMSAGLERYVRTANPDYVMDPRRWLHGRRWEDQDAPVVPVSTPPRGPNTTLAKADKWREEWEREQEASGGR